MSHAELIRNVCAIQLTLTVLRNRGFIEPGRRNRRPLSLRVGIHYRFATTGYTFWIIPFYPFWIFPSSVIFLAGFLNELFAQTEPALPAPRQVFRFLVPGERLEPAEYR